MKIFNKKFSSFFLGNSLVKFFQKNTFETIFQKLSPAFFFPVKIKSARESHFCPFFPFSSRVENFFHGHFFGFFPFFSRVEEKFSRVEFHGLPNFFSRALFCPPLEFAFLGYFHPISEW